ncbi:hypothetical protein BDC45DRAFT_204512 [Circinella umbellata]|nr:hypothetical protein BDC45DRAFT_204512 [Circinella umbellata]
MEAVEYHEKPRATDLISPILGSTVLNNNTICIVSDSTIWSFPAYLLNNVRSQLTEVASVPSTALSPQSFILVPTTSNNESDDGFLIMDGSFKPHQFIIASREWSSRPPSTTSVTITKNNNTFVEQEPSARAEYATTISVSDNQQKSVFIHGGKSILNDTASTTCATDSFWSYHLLQQRWIPIKANNNNNNSNDDFGNYYGHTMSMLSDGRIVMLGGKLCNQHNKLINFTSTLIYDTQNSQWLKQILDGPIPAPRIYHSAITTNQDKIIICGGQNGEPPPFHTYISANNQLGEMAALLDTTTWKWKSIEPSINSQPLPQSKATAFIVNETKIVYGLGETYQTLQDGLYILDSETLNWEPDKNASSQIHNESTAPGTILSVAAIVALCFTFVSLLIVAGILWRVGRNAIFNGISSLKNELWDPRPGEPGWIEISRLTMRFAFGSYLVYLVFSLTSQIIHSPIIEQIYYDETPDGTIDVPDVRFCFDDYRTNEPYVRCATDYGVDCSQYLKKFYPSTSHEKICALFRAPDYVRLAAPTHRKAASGSYLKFDYYGNATQVGITIYHRNHNPNLAVYNLKTEDDTFDWDTSFEEDQFRSSELSTYQQYGKGYLVPANRVHTSSYALGKRIVLKKSWWNYIGYASATVSHYQITSSKMVSEVSPPTYLGNESPLGSLHLFPELYSTEIAAEQRAFTILQALGVLGGMFGLLVTAQHWFFGYRPQSPYGVVQRWSRGQLRMSLLEGLVTNFKQQHENVPIVHPLKKTSAAHIRMGLLEDRLHTLEQLFQAYYIDDEIFKSLDQAFTGPRPPPQATVDNRTLNDNLLRLRLPSFKKPKDDPTTTPM